MTVSRREQVLSYGVLVVFAIVAIYPILSIVLLGVPPQERPRHRLLDPGPPELRHVQPGVERWAALDDGLVNSFIVAASVALVTAILATPAGYAFGTMRSRGSSAAVLPAAHPA